MQDATRLRTAAGRSCTSTIPWKNKTIYWIGYDPYNVNKSDFSRDIHDLPAIQAIDLSCYLVHQTSYYTAKQMKAKKSLEAYDYFTNGWVNLLGTKAALDNHQVVFAKVSVAGLDSY